MKIGIIARHKNDEKFLNLWYRYYSRFFLDRDIYIIDNESTDGSIEKFRLKHIQVNVSTVKTPYVYDEGVLTQAVIDKQFELFTHLNYDVVVYTDIDEFIIPDPSRWKDLRNYIEKIMEEREHIGTHGYEIYQDKNEPSLNFDSNQILNQRNWWCECDFYKKPLITRIPVEWGWGFHDFGIESREWVRADYHLYLFHLQKIDYNYCLEKHRRYNSSKWNPKLDDGIGGYISGHNRIVDDFDKWYYTDRYKWELIPDRFKKVF